VLERARVIHIGRSDLLPYRQEIYDNSGRIMTLVTYDKYTKINGIPFPMLINISRPIDEYTLRIDMSKVTLNQKVEDDQFALTIPEGVPVQKM
jgi:outer membrane lipoprotein-sorting protein